MITKQDLKYDQKAIYRLDDECDIKVQDLADPANMGFATIVKLLWAGLIHQNPRITIDYVLDEHDDIMQNIDKYSEVIVDAFERDFPEQEEAKN